MLVIRDKKLGKVEVSIYVDPHSAVDSSIEHGYDTNGLELSDEALDYLNDNYSDRIQEYAWNSGLTRNHN